MLEKGWVSIYRQLKDHWIWDIKPFDYTHAWIDLILSANHDGRKVPLGNEIVSVERGSFITSQIKLMNSWGWSKTKLLRFLKLLESDGMITIKTDSKKTIITIENYSDYQDSETKKEPEKDCEKTNKKPIEDCEETDERPLGDTNNNVNNSNNVNNEEQLINITPPAQPKKTPTQKVPKVKAERHKYGEYNHVMLSDDEYKRLEEYYGERDALDLIRFLDEYIEMKGYKSQNHCLAIQKWVVEAVNKERVKQGKPQIKKGVNSNGQATGATIEDRRKDDPYADIRDLTPDQRESFGLPRDLPPLPEYVLDDK